MRVVVFARHPSGGIRTYFSYVYGHRSHCENQFKLVAPASESLDALLAPLPNVNVVAQPSENLLFLLFSLLKEVLTNRPSLVHSHGFTAGLIAAFPLWLLRIPHIVTTHDVFMASQFQSLAGRIKKLIMRLLFSLPSRINPVGSDAEKNFTDTFVYLGRSGKVKGIRNGVEASSFLISDERHLKAEAGIPENALVLGFFGRFMAQKGFGLLVDAVQRINSADSGVPLHVCCFGWGGFIREEQADIRSRGLECFFHFFPGTNQMAAAIRGVDAVVMPSKWEACPLLPMEVMISGRALIASDCIGMQEIVKNTPAIVFRSGSLEGLIDGIRLFASDKNTYMKRFEEFRQEAAARFDVGETAKSLLELYTEVVKAKRPKE